MQDNEEELDDEQLEEILAENGLLLHALLEVLIRKGMVTHEEIESQIDQFAEQVDEERE